MTVRWDYSQLSAAYGDRPQYADAAIAAIVQTTGIGSLDRLCDIGAGNGNLTAPLASLGYRIDAVEPDSDMRLLGVRRTAEWPEVMWHDGTGERTGLLSRNYQLVTFGSSFNVVDSSPALIEAARILQSAGWLCCLWNHRDLDDPLQSEIESLIHEQIPEYSYGSRRDDQRPTIRTSGLFAEPMALEFPQVHRVDTSAWINAWRSHATLARQAGPRLASVITAIEELVGTTTDTLQIPYTTRVYLAQALDV